MRSSFFLAASLAALARAVTITSPSEDAVWATSSGASGRLIEWDFVDTDPKSVDIVLVHMRGPPSVTIQLASGVDISLKKFLVTSQIAAGDNNGYQINLEANGGILAQSALFNLSANAAASSSSSSASATSSSASSPSSAASAQSPQGSSSSNGNGGGGGGGSNTNKIALGVAIPFVVLGMSLLLWWLLKTDKVGHSRAGSIRNALSSRSSRASQLSRTPSVAPSQMSARAPTIASNWSAVSDPVPPYERDPFEDESSSNLMTPSSPIRENPFSDTHYAASNVSLEAPPRY